MATHSSTLAWKISWTEEPVRLQSMGSQATVHRVTKSRTRLSDFTFTLLLKLSNSVASYSFATPWIVTPLGFSAHGILHTRILEWVARPSSKGSFWLRDQTWASGIAGWFFTIWSTREGHFIHSSCVAVKPSFPTYPFLISPSVTVSMFSLSVNLYHSFVPFLKIPQVSDVIWYLSLSYFT